MENALTIIYTSMLLGRSDSGILMIDITGAKLGCAYIMSTRKTAEPDDLSYLKPFDRELLKTDVLTKEAALNLSHNGESITRMQEINKSLKLLVNLLGMSFTRLPCT